MTVYAGLADFSDLKTKPTDIGPKEEAVSRAIAKANGYVDRHPVAAMKRNKPVEEPVHSFTARVTIRSLNRFVQYCDRERLSYRDGFDRLTAQLPE